MLHRINWLLCALLIFTACITTSPWLASAENSDGGLNRLFMEPESRARIDATRKGDPVVENSEQNPQASKIRVDGVMIRKNGKNVVWVNGESNINGVKAGGVQVHTRQIDRNNYRVPIRVDQETVRLKPGQTWSGESGKISDDY